ncbi:hypothetical protein EYF80_016138 [Liparis tanakae]|uniref:Uncharacterized protein n=1 Tax=Liparis tanakae TaxID=230148 RepID=A0A4Z2I8V3_9TELE|nr:hypothetical protein EYF80_016138 [Liparis tanakae]
MSFTTPSSSNPVQSSVLISSSSSFFFLLFSAFPPSELLLAGGTLFFPPFLSSSPLRWASFMWASEAAFLQVLAFRTFSPSQAFCLFFSFPTSCFQYWLDFTPVSVLQLTSRLTRPSPDVCQTQLWPSLVVSSPEPGTERFLALLAGSGDGGGCRGFSGFASPGCPLASATTGRQRKRRRRKLHGRTLMISLSASPASLQLTAPGERRSTDVSKRSRMS